MTATENGLNVKKRREFLKHGVWLGGLYVVSGSLVWMILIESASIARSLVEFGRISGLGTLPGSVEDYIQETIKFVLFFWGVGVVGAIVPGVIGGAVLGNVCYELTVRNTLSETKGLVIGALCGAIAGVIVMVIAVPVLETFYHDSLFDKDAIDRLWRLFVRVSIVLTASIAGGIAGRRISRKALDSTGEFG